MNRRASLGTFVVILALATTADAATLIVNGSGLLTGATGVNVGGRSMTWSSWRAPAPPSSMAAITPRPTSSSRLSQRPWQRLKPCWTSTALLRKEVASPEQRASGLQKGPDLPIRCVEQGLVIRFEIERFEYRHAVTNMFLSSCQLIATTSHWNDASEPIVIVSRSPDFGTRSSSMRLTNRTSLLEMVSGESFPSRRTRREGILRLISNMR